MILWADEALVLDCTCRNPAGIKSFCHLCANIKKPKRKHSGAVPAPKRQRSKCDLASSGLTQDFRELSIQIPFPDSSEDESEDKFDTSLGRELNRVGECVKDNESKLQKQQELFMLQQQEIRRQRQELEEMKQIMKAHEITLFRHKESIITNKISLNSQSEAISGLNHLLHRQSETISKQADAMNEHLKCIAAALHNQLGLNQQQTRSLENQNMKYDTLRQTVETLCSEKLNAITNLSDRLSRNNDMKIEVPPVSKVEDIDSDSDLYDDVDETSIIQSAKYSPQISGSHNSIHFHLESVSKASGPTRLRLPPSTRF